MSAASIRRILGVTAVTVGVAGVGWRLARSTLELVTVQGTSMLPTLRDGAVVVVHRRRVGAGHRGRIVLLEIAAVDEATGHPERSRLLKRLVAVAGDPVPDWFVGVLDGGPDPVVPPGRALVLGDHRATSYDSRQHGYIDLVDVLGVALRRGLGPQGSG